MLANHRRKGPTPSIVKVDAWRPNYLFVDKRWRTYARIRRQYHEESVENHVFGEPHRSDAGDVNIPGVSV